MLDDKLTYNGAPERIAVAFKRLCVSDEFRKAHLCVQVLRTLFESFQRDPQHVFSDTEIAEAVELRMSSDHQSASRGQVRTAISDIRSRLRKYRDRNTGNSIIFDVVGNGDYRLAIQHRVPAEDRVRFIFEHRKHTEAWFEETVCGPSSDVLLVSIASQHTLDLLSPWFADGLVKAKHFRVLTWRPRSRLVTASLCEHLGETLPRFAKNLRDAWKSWKQLQDKYEFVEVYGYSSVPTTQGVCSDTAIKVELLPFHRAGLDRGFHGWGSPDRRPAILATVTDSPMTYRVLKESFEDLWTYSMQNTPESAVHPRWRLERRKRLAEHVFLARDVAPIS